MSKKQFPEGFYWGAGSSAHQVEGGIENCDWAEAAREERLPPAGRACDHYHKYEEDFDIAKELSHTAHRFSIEWARIEPEEGKFDQNEIEHYRKVLQALKDRNITPFVTIWHFTLPLWFSRSGGFERPDSPEIFARYATFVVKELGNLCDHFSTINEPNVFASNGWLRGTWPPFKRFKLTELVSITNSGKTYETSPDKGFKPICLYFSVMKNLANAHNAAYEAIKKVSPDTEVSVVKHVIVFDSNWNPFNKIKAWFANFIWTRIFMVRTYKQCDSIGLNYYFYTKFGDKSEWKKTDMDWNYAPERIYDAIMMLKRYHKPLFISEAGIADDDDSDRAEYIKKQVAATWQAMQDGADVRGHLYWSFMDNYELALGFEKRFGLVEIDYETLERKIRPSAYVYKKIIEDNGIVE